MEIVLKNVRFILFISVYILYFVNIHKSVKLISDDNKFRKISYAVAGLHIILKILLETVPFSKQVGDVIWRMGVPLLCLSVFLSHKQHLLKTVYVTLLYSSLEASLGTVINILIDVIVPIKYRDYSGVALYFLLNLAYYFILTRYLTQKAEDLRLSLEFINRKTYIFILIYARILSKLISVTRAAENMKFTSVKLLFYVKLYIIPICIISMFIIILLISNSMSKFYYKRSAELLDKQLDMQAKYYEKIDEMTTDIRKFRHDYKNHMHCLKSLLGSKKIDDALEYLDSISANPTMNKTSFKSGNTIADAILNDKAAIAAHENFRLNFSGVISEKVSAFDICTILSNALDNSIEACRRLKSAKDKYIDVNCVLKNDMQMICISNPSDTDDPDLKTSKDNKNEHGFGLYNIKKTVDSLDGTVNIAQTTPVFVLDVMFRIKMPETA